MPQRKANVKIPTPEVQGDDSWVVLRPAKLGQIQALMSMSNASLTTDLEAQKAVLDNIAALIDELLLDWNWVDENGDPLQTPQQGASSAALLTMDEIIYLSQKIAASMNDINIEAKKKATL